jgi:hypothetical protein
MLIELSACILLKYMIYMMSGKECLLHAYEVRRQRNEYKTFMFHLQLHE